MKILHVDETFHPAFGYQANPLAKFQQKQGNEVYIVTPTKEYMYPVYKEFGDNGDGIEKKDAQYEKETGVKIIRIPAKGYFMRRLVYGNEIFKIVDEINPDVLFVHCVETLTAMRFLLKKPRYPMMFDSHMLSMASNNKLARIYEFVYKNVFTRIIKKQKYDVIRTQDDLYVNKCLGIPKSQTPFISFGTDTILFSPSYDERVKFRKENGISEDSFVVVYTGKLTEAKGGKLLANAFMKKFKTKITLVCVGTPPDNDYGKKVMEIFKKSENEIKFFPTQGYLELAKFYQQADLSVFPKQCSMSFYDAQACGLPVLSEDNNINIERCSHKNGWNFKAGNIDDFRKKIEEISRIDGRVMAKYKENAREFVKSGYDYEDIAKQYTEYLRKAIKNFKNNKDI